ncbi:hypothetical protein [Cupriavidus sp. DL-D2]|uniref:phage fiber-tail adaptor protein n=1 Tax=Cupriavidus sp. DL-D2 TaxID=3144974 RepID=UPI0032155977
MTNAFPPKDPAAVLDYCFDWSGWLTDGETIPDGGAVITAPGLTINPDGKTTQIEGGKVVFWLGGGVAETFCDVSCQISTSAGRKDRRTSTLRIAPRPVI